MGGTWFQGHLDAPGPCAPSQLALPKVPSRQHLLRCPSATQESGKDPCDYKGLSQTTQDNLSNPRSSTFNAPFATEGNSHRFWALECGYPLGVIIQPSTGHLENAKSPAQGQSSPSSAAPQGLVRVAEGLDPKGVPLGEKAQSCPPGT